MDTANMKDEYVNFGDVARQQLGMQCQYASHYLYPDNDPFLGKGLRFLWGIEGDYHSIRIHKDDVEEFIRRVKEVRNG